MKRACAVSSLIALVAATTPALTQGSTLSIELNAAQPTDKGCRLVFVVQNDLGKPLTRAALEFALFDASGVVDRLTVLEFKDIPAAKTKVSRFELPGVQCSGLSRLLVNDVTACEGEGIDPAACRTGLKTTNKTSLEFGL